jgi:hypothetical protein
MTGAAGEFDALTRVAQMRATLARAGRWDLADLAWRELCPRGILLQARHDALKAAGYPFGVRPGEDSPSLLLERSPVTVTKGDTIHIVPERGPERLMHVVHVEQHIITMNDLPENESEH